MKALLRAARIVFAILPAAFCWAGKTNLLHGLTYDGGKEKVAGRLMFLTSAETLPSTNGLKPCFLYEFDMETQKLRRVTQAPTGRHFERVFMCADGKACAATFPEQNEAGGGHQGDRPQSVWMYCEAPPVNRILSLGGVPEVSVAVGHHLFFQIAPSIVVCDLESGTSQLLELPGASKWERERLQFMHAHEGKTNELHFDYFRRGARLSEGKDYDSGTSFVYDILTEQYRSTSEPKPSSTEGFRACDGNLVSLAEIDDPFEGYELIRYVSPGNQLQSGKDGTGKSTIMLKRFRRTPSNDITDIQMSPCRNYVLIREERQIHPLRPGGYDTMRTYHIVNVLTGHAWVLVKDDVERKTGGFISQIEWLPSRAGDR